MDKSEALRLANSLAAHSLSRHGQTQAAAELRRLHAENASLSAALASSCDEQRHELWESGGVAGCERARVAERQRDALLEVLRRIAMASEATVCNQEWIAKTARAAIALCEGPVAAVEKTK